MSFGTFVAIDKSHEPVIDDIMASLESCVPETWYYSEERCQSPERQRRDYITSLKYDSTLQHGFTVNLILSLVTNLSQLSFKSTSYSKYGQYMLPSENLGTLRELSLIGDELGRFKLRQVKDLCKRAPKLEKLTFDSCVRTASNLPLDNLRSLKFENSLIAKGDLSKLVRSCTNLTSFAYYSSSSWPMYEALNRSAPLLAPKDIIEELSPCKETLQHLDIMFSDWAVQIYLWYNNVLVTSMKEFSNLKTLKLNEICFYCELTENKRIISTIDDLLPSSIEVVVLDQIRPQSAVVVEELERHARAQPNLRDFTIYNSAELDWWMREYH